MAPSAIASSESEAAGSSSAGKALAFQRCRAASGLNKSSTRGLKHHPISTTPRRQLAADLGARSRAVVSGGPS
jgi:hypothetical protein